MSPPYNERERQPTIVFSPLFLFFFFSFFFWLKKKKKKKKKKKNRAIFVSAGRVRNVGLLGDDRRVSDVNEVLRGPQGVHLLRWPPVRNWQAALRAHPGRHHQGRCHSLRPPGVFIIFFFLFLKKAGTWFDSSLSFPPTQLPYFQIDRAPCRPSLWLGLPWPACGVRD